jgi:23S rRNA (uracil1939-C5)-methyltransferase
VDYLREVVLQRERPELIVLDPPRAGAGTEVCQLITQIAPQNVVYVSCDPVTLGRDLATLQPNYEIESLRLVDLFPQTYHQEAVVNLRRRS